VIDAATKADVSHIVHLGAHASPDTTIVHLGWHQLVEAYQAQSGLATTNLHPTSFMQNLFTMTATGVLRHYIGDAAPSWVDADDVAKAAAVVLRAPAEHVGRSYLLSA
jgi:NAD(P)H dehydrogenase (quinone)